MLICMILGIGAGQISDPNSLPFCLWPHTLIADARDAGIGSKKDCTYIDWSVSFILSLGGRREKKID